MKTKVVKLDPEKPDYKELNHCAKVIQSGGLVIFPTETVYGIAADSSNAKAIKRLYSVKKRSEDKSFSLLISRKENIFKHTSTANPVLYKLIHQYWPGPLTVVVPAQEEGKTIALRMPDHPIALVLVEQSGRAIAAPSANFEGNPAPLTCQEALKDLDGLIDMAIDSGKTEIGKSSTIVDLSGENPHLLREGSISVEDIKKTKESKTILFVCTGNSCRSVMAEYLLKSQVQHKKDIEIISAGTGVFIQLTASPQTISVLKDEGIDASQHISQPMDALMLKRADLILVMTQGHRQQILEYVPEVEKRVYLLREFVNISSNSQQDLDIPDPIGRPFHAYKDCLASIKEAIHKVVNLI